MPAASVPSAMRGVSIWIAVKEIDSAALQNLEEELKQTSAAHNFVCYAVEAHLTNQHTQARGDRLAA